MLIKRQKFLKQTVTELAKYIQNKLLFFKSLITSSFRIPLLQLVLFPPPQNILILEKKKTYINHYYMEYPRMSVEIPNLGS